MNSSFEDEFRRLLNDSANSPFGLARRHLTFEYIRLYLRIGPRLIGTERMQCLQIATADASPKHRGSGGFKRFLLAARQLTDLPFYGENVLNKRLELSYIKLGFVVQSRDAIGTADVYRLT